LFFVNKRLISNAAISVALKRGFEGMIHHDTYPVALLHIQVQPQKIDVNVHPTKSQVRFEDEQTLFKVVYHCTKETLRANQLMRDVDVAPMQKKLTEESVSVVQPALATYHVSDSSQEVLDKKEEYVTTESSKLPSLRVLGLVHNKFIIAETDTDMLLVDFHAAHERINYEKLKEKYSKEGVKIQQLVTPAVLEVDVALVAGFQKRKDLLGTLGFLVEEFGKNSLLIRSVPSIFGQQMKPDMVIELLEYAMENKKNPIDKIKDDMLARMACRMSYMAGDELTFPQMKTIINDLHELDIAYSCPHGRPIIVKFSDTELDKLFERRM